LNPTIIWQIAGIAVLVIVIHAVLKSAGRDEFAWLTVLVGLTVVLYLAVRTVADLFQTVRALFQF
jgi:stage III sporulation protein AC